MNLNREDQLCINGVSVTSMSKYKITIPISECLNLKTTETKALIDCGAEGVTIVLRGALCLPLFGMLSQTLFHSPSLSHSLHVPDHSGLPLCLSHVRHLFTCYLPFITCLQYSHVK